MPDGAQVQFPDGMPADQIKGMIQKKFPNTDFTGADPGFWAGAGRALRGVGTGFASDLEQIDPFIKPEERALTKHPPKDLAESIGVAGGQILPVFALPELGVGRAIGGALRAGQAAFMPSSMAVARSIPIAESLAEGGAQGALGGAMIPGDDHSGNAAAGALAGAGLRGAGKLTRAVIDAIPLHIKNTLSALAAAAAASKLGMPWWATMLGHGGWNPAAQQYTGSLYNQMYNAGLADLAAKYFEKVTRAKPAAVGGTAAEIKEKAQ